MKKRLLGTLLALLVAVAGCLVSFYRADVPFEDLRRDYADEASRFVAVEGLDVHYKDEGTGPVLVLLHGFASSLHTWDGWVAELRRDFRLVRLDLPGHGLTGPNAEHDYRTTTYVSFLDRFLTEAGVETFSLAGNSMGGGIAWLYAAQHPEKARRLVLIDAAGAPRTAAGSGPASRGGDSSVMRFIGLPVVKDLIPRITPRFLFKKALYEVYADDSKVTQELVDRHYRLTLRAGNRAALAARLNQPGEALGDLVPSIGQSTLVMWGREDTWIPVSNAERFHAVLPSSELLIYDDVGHLPMEEIPVRSAADARAFLRRASAVDQGEADTGPGGFAKGLAQGGFEDGADGTDSLVAQHTPGVDLLAAEADGEVDLDRLVDAERNRGQMCRVVTGGDVSHTRAPAVKEIVVAGLESDEAQPTLAVRRAG